MDVPMLQSVSCLIRRFRTNRQNLRQRVTCRLSLEILEDRLPPASLRFGVIGDYGWAGKPEADVANQVASWKPDLVITTGDNNYEFGLAATIDQNIGQYFHQYIYPYTGSYGA